MGLVPMLPLLSGTVKLVLLGSTAALPRLLYIPLSGLLRFRLDLLSSGVPALGLAEPLSVLPRRLSEVLPRRDPPPLPTLPLRLPPLMGASTNS